MRPVERVLILVDASNAGNIERVLDGLTPDIEVLIPLYRINEMAGPPMLTGKEVLRQHLASRYDTGSRIELTSIYEGGSVAVAMLTSYKQGQLGVSFKFDKEGLVQRVVVFKQ